MDTDEILAFFGIALIVACLLLSVLTTSGCATLSTTGDAGASAQIAKGDCGTELQLALDAAGKARSPVPGTPLEVMLEAEAPAKVSVRYACYATPDSPPDAPVTQPAPAEVKP